MKRCLRHAWHWLLAMLMLSLAGGYAVAWLSRGLQPEWATWGARITLHDSPSVGDGFLVATRFDSVLYRWVSLAVFPESRRASFESYKESQNQSMVVEEQPPARMMREVSAGIRQSFRGSVGPVLGVWSWHWRTSERQSLNLGFPPSGVIRVLGVPFAYRPVFPGFFVAWAVSYALLRGLLAAATCCFRAAKRLIARYRPQPGHCQSCGYDLSGINGSVCPECGQETPGASEKAQP